MFYWKITHYKDGLPENSWTSCSDIGRSFGRHVLTRDEYVRVESLYTELALRCFIASGELSLRIHDLELRTANVESGRRLGLNTPLVGLNQEDGAKVTSDTLQHACECNLREVAWCRLESQTFVIHFGYDMYMYVGCSIDVSRMIQVEAETSELEIVPIMDSPHSVEKS